MSVHQNINDIAEIDAPWGKRVQVQEVTYDGGLKLLRLRIREGRRITDLELGADTAQGLAEILAVWAAQSLS